MNVNLLSRLLSRKETCCIKEHKSDRINDANEITVTIEGKGNYEYPSAYGTLECKAHDQYKDPDCGLKAAADGQEAEHCASEWCFIDTSNINCAIVESEPSGYVKGQFYSYTYCNNTDVYSEEN